MRKFYLALIVFFPLTLLGCGPGNNVRLLAPPPIEASALPAPNAPAISVVLFANKQAKPEVVGKRRDGSAFTTSNDVAQWITRALADELARKGFRVTFAQDTAQARSGNPDYLVTGTVEQVWLTEPSAVELTAQLRVLCALSNRKGKIWSETTNSSQTQGGLMSSGSADTLLQQTMTNLIQPIVQKIIVSIEKHK